MLAGCPVVEEAAVLLTSWSLAIEDMAKILRDGLLSNSYFQALQHCTLFKCTIWAHFTTERNPVKQGLLVHCPAHKSAGPEDSGSEQAGKYQAENVVLKIS